jgi:hypothetical protein
VSFVATTAHLFIWPTLPPLPARADAITKLGGPGDRDDAARALARDGRAPMLVRSYAAGEPVRCLPPAPGVTTVCFHAVPETTRGEARIIGDLAKQYGWRSIILVTTPDQAWRARLRVSRCFDGEVYVSTTPLPVLQWPQQITYQWIATAKALTVETDC